MLPPKLIFIEGLPGAGKSTAAEVIAERIQRRGLDCRWYHDSDVHHPIQPPLGDPDDLAVHMVRQWQDFVADVRDSATIVIVENRLWMRSAMHLFMRTDAPGTLHRYQHAVTAALAPLEPALIYLEQDSVAMALGRLYGVRGREQLNKEIAQAEEELWFQARELTGFEGWLYFFANWMTLLQQLYEAWPFARFRIKNAHEHWPRAYDDAMTFLFSRRSTPGEA